MEKIFCDARHALIIMIQSGMSAIEPQLTIVALSTSTRLGKSAFFPQVKDLWKSLQIKFVKTSIMSSFPDDSISLPTGLQQDQDFTFSERAGCNNGEITIGRFSER